MQKNLDIMNIVYYNRSFLLEAINNQKIFISIKKMDKSSETAKSVYKIEITIYFAIFIAFLLAVFFLLLLPIILVIISIVAIYYWSRKPQPEPTYEEACRWFEEGNGYYQNLSPEERKKWLARKDNLPLGL